MKAIRIERLDLDLKGVSPATAKSALVHLPGALSAGFASDLGGADGLTAEIGRDGRALARVIARHLLREIDRRQSPRQRRTRGGAN